MICRRMTAYMLVIGFALWGCTGIHQSPSRWVWIAQPEFIEVNNQMLRARIEPQKGEFPFYAFFLLTITNKSSAALMIDWNASQYLFNGRANGVFVFEGIDPEAVKSATVPMEVVAPGSVATREILPLRLVAWSPIREKTANGRSITPGMIPAGENGIRLAVRYADRQMTIPLSIRISRKDSP
jgi:hypothetical protein